jgi:hypothetical protein
MKLTSAPAAINSLITAAVPLTIANVKWSLLFVGDVIGVHPVFEQYRNVLQVAARSGFYQGRRGFVVSIYGRSMIEQQATDAGIPTGPTGPQQCVLFAVF